MNLREIFPQFDQRLTDELLQIGREVSLKEHDLMMRTGQYFKSILLILEGTVKVYREGQEGEEFFLYYLSKGNACALSMIYATRQETSPIKASAVTPVKMLAIPLSFMDNLMKNHREWYYFVLDTYRARFDELLQTIDQIAFHSMDEKLEFYLKRQFENLGRNTLPMTHQAIAQDLNSSREVITRLLNKLEGQKRIALSRHSITNLKL